MKRFLSLALALVVMLAVGGLSVSAAEIFQQSPIESIEYLENGDYIVTEMRLYPAYSVFATTGAISGNKTATYYNSTGSKVWDVTVLGTFSYTYGESATATSASAVVNIYNSKAKFVSKSAYTSGNTATATGTVTYNALKTTKSVSVSCDKYGNLS